MRSKPTSAKHTSRDHRGGSGAVCAHGFHKALSISEDICDARLVEHTKFNLVPSYCLWPLCVAVQGFRQASKQLHLGDVWYMDCMADSIVESTTMQAMRSFGSRQSPIHLDLLAGLKGSGGTLVAPRTRISPSTVFSEFGEVFIFFVCGTFRFVSKRRAVIIPK